MHVLVRLHLAVEPVGGSLAAGECLVVMPDPDRLRDLSAHLRAVRVIGPNGLAAGIPQTRRKGEFSRDYGHHMPCTSGQNMSSTPLSPLAWIFSCVSAQLCGVISRSSIGSYARGSSACWEAPAAAAAAASLRAANHMAVEAQGHGREQGRWRSMADLAERRGPPRARTSSISTRILF